MLWVNKKLRTARQLWKLGGWHSIRRAIEKKLFPSNPWTEYSEEAAVLAPYLDFSLAVVEASKNLQASHPDPLDIHSITWFIPDFSHPYYGGIYTVLRCADYLRVRKDIVSQFVVIGGAAESEIAPLIAQAFPSLSDAMVRQITDYWELEGIAATDVSVATLWSTAYFLLSFNSTKRKFYFMQDYEPLFYPAGSVYAQVEATYRFGFYGIANTPSIKAIYEAQYGGVAESFVPCVDTSVFRPAVDGAAAPSKPYRVFFYGRPEHPRNGFELGVVALKKLKERLGDQVHVVSAGAVWNLRDYGLRGIVENLGLLSYEQTAELYRGCHVGLVMMFTRHPSYLPLELMASGCLVVSNHNPATRWLLKDGENCLLAESSMSCLTETLERSLLDAQERERITANAVKEIQTYYSDWDKELERIYRFMCGPLAKPP